jgi:hypothetical protein
MNIPQRGIFVPGFKIGFRVESGRSESVPDDSKAAPFSAQRRGYVKYAR